MSHNNSSCIPPPNSYAPRGRGGQSGRSFERGGGRGGRGHRGRPPGPYKNNTPRDQTNDDQKNLKHQPKDRFHRNDDDDYFARVENDEEEEEKNNNDATEQSDAPHQSSDYSRSTTPSGGQNDQEEEEDDPLDAYMKSLEQSKSCSSEVHKTESVDQSNQAIESTSDERPTSSNGPNQPGESQAIDKRGVRLDIDDVEDMEESYYKYVEETRGKKAADQSNHDKPDERLELVDYDADGNALSARRLKKEIDPLPMIDHSKIEYANFERNFYQEHDEINKLTIEQGDELRAKLEIKVTGNLPPKPVCSFAHFKFDEQLMKVIRRSEYTTPTPIQAQAIPAALLGRNIIGIAMTGSGKTAAYLWPMIVHIMGQPDLKRGDGPIALVLVPTRELALQVYGEAKKFSSSYKIATVCAYGGGSKYEQSKDLEQGAEIVVATPGRMIDLIKLGVTNLRRVTYLVLDEADRFFEMGFEAQVRSICDHIRPDRQTLLFSATFRKKIEHLARTVTEDPVKIVQKALGEANEDVTQHVIVIQSTGPHKLNWLTSKLVEFTSAGSVLIFVTRILNCEELHKSLQENGSDTLLLHGDMEQAERNRVITAFKRKEKEIMIATDVAARGLDIAHIRTVINYDVARDIDTHTHRIGRTGRAGTKGDAYTLITERDREFAAHLVKNLEASNQEVGEELKRLAMQSQSYKKNRGHSQHSQHQPQNQQRYYSRRESAGHSGSGNYQHHNQHHQQHHQNNHQHHQPYQAYQQHQQHQHHQPHQHHQQHQQHQHHQQHQQHHQHHQHHNQHHQYHNQQQQESGRDYYPREQQRQYGGERQHSSGYHHQQDRRAFEPSAHHSARRDRSPPDREGPHSAAAPWPGHRDSSWGHPSDNQRPEQQKRPRWNQ